MYDDIVGVRLNCHYAIKINSKLFGNNSEKGRTTRFSIKRESALLKKLRVTFAKHLIKIKSIARFLRPGKKLRSE